MSRLCRKPGLARENKKKSNFATEHITQHSSVDSLIYFHTSTRQLFSEIKNSLKRVPLISRVRVT